MKTLFKNRQATHEYAIEDTLTAGIMLEGWEVKSLLASQATFNAGNAFVRLVGGEAFLEAFTIQPLAQTNMGLLAERNPLRSRKLLLTRHEIDKWSKKVAERGFTIVPLEFMQGRKLKIVIGLAKGKNLRDKRETVKARDLDREIARELSN